LLKLHGVFLAGLHPVVARVRSLDKQLRLLDRAMSALPIQAAIGPVRRIAVITSSTVRTSLNTGITTESLKPSGKR